MVRLDLILIRNVHHVFLFVERTRVPILLRRRFRRKNFSVLRKVEQTCQIFNIHFLSVICADADQRISLPPKQKRRARPASRYAASHQHRMLLRKVDRPVSVQQKHAVGLTAVRRIVLYGQGLQAEHPVLKSVNAANAMLVHNLRNLLPRRIRDPFDLPGRSIDLKQSKAAPRGIPVLRLRYAHIRRTPDRVLLDEQRPNI